MGFPGGTTGEELACQCWRHKRRGFNPWVGKIPWRRAWQPIPVLLPTESHGQRSLVGYSPKGRSWTRLKQLSTHARTHFWWPHWGEGAAPVSTEMLLNIPSSARQHPHSKELSAPNVHGIQDGKHCFITQRFYLRFSTAEPLGKPRVLVYLASKVKEVCNAS